MKALAAMGLMAIAGCPGDYRLGLPARAEQYRVKTPDGWEVSLIHYAVTAPVPGSAPLPVLVCHGISAGDRSVDLDDEHSLPRWLAAHGRDAWSLSVRGSGLSDGPDPDHGRQGDYDFDALWKEDFTAAVAYVGKATGARAVDVVGHSMGGLMIYAYLAEGGLGVNAAVTLGAPTRLDWGSRYAGALARAGALFTHRFVPVVAAARSVMPLQGELPNNPTDVLLYNPKNVSKQTWKRLIATGIADIAPQVAAQLLLLIAEGKFQSRDGKHDYRREMAHITQPVLVVAGKADRLASPPAAKDGYRALGGPKEWLLLGEETGTVADYGHMDLVLGDRNATELWPRVKDFLDRHALASKAASP